MTDMKTQLETVQVEHNTLWEAMKPLALLFHTPEDGERKWVYIVKQIPSRFEGYVHGATKVYVHNVLGTLWVLYLVVDLHQVTIDYDSEEHLATMERAKEQLDGLATIIIKDLDLRMEKLGSVSL